MNKAVQNSYNIQCKVLCGGNLVVVKEKAGAELCQVQIKLCCAKFKSSCASQFHMKLPTGAELGNTVLQLWNEINYYCKSK